MWWLLNISAHVVVAEYLKINRRRSGYSKSTERKVILSGLGACEKQGNWCLCLEWLAHVLGIQYWWLEQAWNNQISTVQSHRKQWDWVFTLASTSLTISHCLFHEDPLNLSIWYQHWIKMFVVMWGLRCHPHAPVWLEIWVFSFSYGVVRFS